MSLEPNPYNKPLIAFYEKILDLIQATFRVNNVLKKDLERFSKKDSLIFVGTKLGVRDWTYLQGGTQEYGLTGVNKILLKENYASEVEKIISRECCLTFAQAIENLETLFINFIVQKYASDQDFRGHFKCDPKNLRSHLRNNSNLFQAIKIAGKENFASFSRLNYFNIPFKEFWTVIKETRHAITHSNQRIEKYKINASHKHIEILDMLFHFEELNDGELILLQMNNEILKNTIDLIVGFAFQVYKALSLEESLPLAIRVENTNGEKLSDSNPALAQFLKNI